MAVIGAGPAGLAAAHDLALRGYDVTVFEGAGEPGGMMRFGIPEYRLPRTLIRAEIDKILALGVTLRLGAPLGADYGLAELRRDGFEAVFLSVGVSAGRDLQVPGVELDGVVKAVDYLLNVNRGYRVDLGRRVVVIGGGFVAFDAARTALRVSREDEVAALEQELAGETDARVKEAFDSARAALRGGAAEVTIISLETFDEMPVLRTTQGHEEFEEAQKEGVRFITRRGPRRFLGRQRLQAVELRKVLSVFDDEGRFAPSYDDGDVETMEADACVLAIGQKPDLSFLHDERRRRADARAAPSRWIPRRSPRARRACSPAATSRSGRATSSRPWPTASAPRVRSTSTSRPKPRSSRCALDIEQLPTSRYRMIAGFEILDRETPPTLDLGRRTGIAEVETGYAAEAARRQAARCLVCHVQTIYDPEKCVLCNRCVDICPEYCLAIVPFDEVDLPAEAREAPGRARTGQRPAAVGDGQGRRALHPVRAVRHSVPHRRDDDGALHDHRTLRAGRACGRRGPRRETAMSDNVKPLTTTAAGGAKAPGGTAATSW